MINEVVYSKKKQIELRLLNAIETGLYPLGICIPSENDLMSMTGASRVTVRAAISALVEKGYLKRIQGKGTVVIKSKTETLLPSIKPVYVITVNPHVNDFFGAGILSGVHEGLLNKDCPVFLKNIPLANDFITYVERSIKQDNCSGVILSGSLSDKKFAEPILRKNIPCVSIGIPSDGANIPYVEVNHEYGIFSAVKKLALLGHERIAFFDYTKSFNHIPSALARLEGYKNAVKSFGLQLDSSLIVKYSDHSNEGIKYAREFILNRNYTAVIIVGYGFVTEYVSELLSNGITIPEDLSIINYKAYVDFNDETGLLMTCMVQPLSEMGKAAVDLLFNKGNNPERSILFNPIFIKGQTISPKKDLVVQEKNSK